MVYQQTWLSRPSIFHLFTEGWAQKCLYLSAKQYLAFIGCSINIFGSLENRLKFRYQEAVREDGSGMVTGGPEDRRKHSKMGSG